ncbi:hypothetical protein NKJ72_12095 [Mesorhizobium sp. M0045]|uniref:ATP-binding protein n=1 Tax=Mesorhizobium sp. M0045 TaxID=2956857 RepID=UPI003338FE1B
MTVGARTRFFTAFGEALLRSNSGTLHLIIDEAHLFAPQGRVNDPQSGAMLHAANNLVSLGRGIGLRIILISQRPAKLHKDSLTQVETLIAMRLIAPQDRKAIEEWVGEWADAGKGKEITASLPSLPTGEAWVWSPEIDFLKRVKFPLAATFDSGKPTAQQQALHPIDVEEMGTRLESIRQEAKANDPKILKARIAELERAKPAIDPKAIEQAEARGYDKAFTEMAAASDKARKILARRHDELIEDLRTSLWREIEGASVFTRSYAQQTLTVAIAAEKQPKRPETIVPKTEMPPQPANVSISPARWRILVALRDLEAIGQTAPDKQVVAWFADASPKSSAFANNLGSLRSSGVIDYPGQGTVALTDVGRNAVPERNAPTHEHIMGLVAGKLTPALRRMLDAAVAVYPGAISTADLAEAAGASPTSSAFANNRGRLRSLGLIDYPSSGQVRAADLLFPGGIR